MEPVSAPPIDPYAKERQLKQEAESWDTRNLTAAQDGDIPVIDISGLSCSEPAEKTCRDTDALKSIAQELKHACETVGFFYLQGHGLEQLVQTMLDQARQFHAQPLEIKQAILMDGPGRPGMGYLPFGHFKLPTRSKPNLNEALVLKCSPPRFTLKDNPWPESENLPDFRATVEEYSKAMLKLTKRLLPAFALALDMPHDFFNAAFEDSFFRIRMTRYPPLRAIPSTSHDFDSNVDERHGGEELFSSIPPHVDTSIITILAQDRPGLALFHEPRKVWLSVPLVENLLIVNVGELFRQWTNDRFLSVKHFATNNLQIITPTDGGRISKEENDDENLSRYSVPFFLNPNADFVMKCIPSCCSDSNPAKYLPMSYATSQAVAQGE